MIRTKEVLRRLLSRLVVHSGMTAATRKLRNQDGALIFYGHRLAANDEGFLQGLDPVWFDEQLAYLTRHFIPLPLSELVRCFEERRPIPSGAVVMTFDDGFKDNLSNGLPLLSRYGVGATIFVVTRCASTGELPWPQRLGYLFQHTEKRELPCDLADGGVFHLGSAADRHRAYVLVKEGLKAQVRDERDDRIARLAEELDVVAPSDRMLSWADLRELQRNGIEIGAHTYSHAHLARIPLHDAREEMRRSLDDLREHLGVERPFFCFPAGSFSATLAGMARELGFSGCFRSSRRRRYNRLDTSDQFGLSRLGLPNAPGYVLGAEIDGPFHKIRSIYRRN